MIDALLAQGCDEEALQLTERWRPERLTVPEDVDAHVGWRRVRAKALARNGELEAAERVGREAVAIASATDYLNARAQATADLGEVLRFVGHPEESRAALAEAIQLYEAKGNIVGARRVRGLLAEQAIEA